MKDFATKLEATCKKIPTYGDHPCSFIGSRHISKKCKCNANEGFAFSLPTSYKMGCNLARTLFSIVAKCLGSRTLRITKWQCHA